MQIRFQDIRNHGTSAQSAFEELVCQLARRDAPPTGGEFRRIEGSGGDGGIEGYWLGPDNQKAGYQAKLFLRSSEIKWNQIDSSVRTAIGLHRDLTKYVIAIGCDFTEKSGKHKRGSTAWGRWDEHKKKWQELAKRELGRKVEFVAWTASEILERLSRSEAAGLRAYWFGQTEFSASWFKSHIRLVTASLDERYHPEDHVDVGLQKLFSFIARDAEAREGLRTRIRRFRELRFPNLDGLSLAFPGSSLEDAKRFFTELRVSEHVADAPSWMPWDVAQVGQLASSLVTALQPLRSTLWEQERTKVAELDRVQREALRSRNHELSEVLEAADSLRNFVAGRYFHAETARTALLEGRAGSGKSHLLASIAETIATKGHPVIMLLGQQFQSGPLWPQITARLGLGDITPDALLGALDAAAEAAKVRGLVLVDALNEGAGSALWRNELASFLLQIQKYPNLACIVSCRSEYLEYVVPKGLLDALPRFEVRGFETLEEQERAAHVYLDRRGISRPATPWLAPEFTNPLFLRSCCNALQNEGKTQFPTGLRGIREILGLYISSAARHLGVGRDGSDDLVGPTKAALAEIATQMARTQLDFVSRTKAHEITSRLFKAFLFPGGLTWLEVLQRNGLVRLDPDPLSAPSDALDSSEDVVRFGFQRFQDHLIAESLLESVQDVAAAVADKGGLAFIREGEAISPRWDGLFYALCIAVPEKFKIELVDALPGSFDRWWRRWNVQDACVESFRWRSRASFGGRALELFNRLTFQEAIQDRLLVEFSSSTDHPWNAEFLTRNLLKLRLPVRDSRWTVAISNHADDESHPVHRLLDWCFRGQTSRVLEETRWLASLCVSWLLTSTNRKVRDTATKALTSLLVAEPDLFERIVSRLHDVDDPYVLERLWAAAYGAACIDSSPERLRSYSMTACRTVFEAREVPKSILLRDYARGVVELANDRRVLPREVTLERCRPPYRTKLPKLSVTEAALRRIAQKAGDNSIVRSCVGIVADFGVYEIQSALGHFRPIDLSESPPLSNNQLRKRFEAEVVEIEESRKNAYKALNQAKWHNHSIGFLTSSRMSRQPGRSELARLGKEIETREANFLTLLSATERSRYETEISKRGYKDDSPVIEYEAAKRWIAARAYRIGWTKKRFARHEQRFSEYSRNRPPIERIGKKYQWIALDELLCAFADNFWLGNEFESAPSQYDLPTELGFIRDIDPTVLPIPVATAREQIVQSKIAGPAVTLNWVSEAQLAAWPFEVDPAKSLRRLIQRAQTCGRVWVPLYEHRHSVLDREPDETAWVPMRQQGFHFLMTTIVRSQDQKRLINKLRGAKSLDVQEWTPPESTDGPFLLEAPWRSTWRQAQWEDDWRGGTSIKLARPLYEYRWERHLDASLSDGASAYLLSPWLARALRLSPSGSDSTSYIDEQGEAKFLTSRIDDGGGVASIEAKTFESFLKDHDFTCIWLFVAERSSYAKTREESTRQRSEGIAWYEAGRLRQATWSRKE